MPKFVVKAWLLPLLLISSNGVLGWLINQLPSNKDLHIPDSAILWLTGGSIVALLILTLLSNDTQQNSATANQNWIGGLLPLVGGLILAILLYLKLIPTELTTVFTYISIGMFGLGSVLPPVLILPKRWRKLLLWLLPGAGLFITIHFILKQQSTAAIISLILTVIVTSLLAAQEFFKTLITNLAQIWEEWQRQGAISVAAWIKSKIEDLWIESTSPFKREYYQTLIYKCRDYETQGLDKDHILKLQKVFIPLKISATEAVNVCHQLIYQPRNEANHLREKLIWDFLAAKNKEGKIQFPRIVILGAPGSGKTTLLRHLTLIYATKQQSKVTPPAPKLIPVLLYLREVRQEIINNNPSLPDLINQQIKLQKLNNQPLNPPPNWFADKLRANKCLVMLDGLDEVADEQERQHISRWVDKQMQDYPDTAFILTSRPNGYKAARLQESVIVLEAKPFNRQQRKDFLQNWYLQTEVISRGGEEDEGVKQEAEKQADDLISRIQNNRPLTAMAVNPLLLTMIATVHRRGSALPGKRVELYKEICQILLERRQRAKKIPDTLTASQKQSVLQVLAVELMQKKTREFTISEGTSLIQHQLVTFPQKLANPEDFLKHIRDECGLLVEKELGIYEFAHLSFQEYLAAVQIKESNKEDLLIANINNTWWAETIRLYAAQINNASNLMRAVIDVPSPSVNTLLLVCDYEEEGWHVDPSLRQQLINKLDAGLESNDPEIFQLAAQVKLARRLRNLQWIDENLEIDTSYITCAEYQLFIDAQRSGQTSQSQNIRFPAGNAKNPITKMSWTDAIGFCQWLNLSTLSQSSNNNENNALSYYRLPTLAEAQNYSTKEHKQLRCWTINGSNTPKNGIRVVRNPVSQEYTKLANYLTAGDWDKAAQETVKVMLKLAHQESEGEFDVASIEKIPCSCLLNINQLWMHGRFGWGVRESVGFPANSGDSRCSWWLNVSGNVKEIYEVLVQKHLACGIERLSPLFAFDVVTVNAQGQEIQWERRQAEYFTEDLGNSITLEMVAIPGGTFLIGSPETEAERHESESPQHQVTVQPFFMGKYPITQAQWRAVAALPRVNRELNPNPSHFKGDDLPVETISWYEAVEFCDRVSKSTKRHYRLPSEAEWEYACRAGTTTPFHFGETITPKLANYNGEYTYGSNPKGENRRQTTPVGSFQVANAFGLYDLHGNVWEWCADHWHDNYKGAPQDGSVWRKNNQKICDSDNLLLRGGSWFDNAAYCRSANRNPNYAVHLHHYIGFRVLCTAARTW
ncbi:MAG: SUMF1/EgtB/PvdO family nonheme iron enzyme [Iphinoe sp. HA4291-MV1]|jgi:formylglycine-generating enzyme required for sulfatase activity/energy-coupling factor transporter ATP-binding protein EcfA2/FtsH-binding integral membrane protein|nr:SUMF1/EgtB/PvdO family nonheme iron enzyme [Iphinoe sp. HA4291-MV1]